MPRLTNKAKLMQQVSLRMLIDANALPEAYNTPWTDLSNAFNLATISQPIDVCDAIEAHPVLKKKCEQVFLKSNQLTLFKSPCGDWLKTHFSLDNISYQLIFICQLISNERYLKEIANSMGDLNDRELFELLALILACPVKEVVKRLTQGSSIIKNKLVKVSSISNEFTRKVETSEVIKDHLFNPYFENENLLNGYLSKVQRPLLDVKTFGRIDQDVSWLIDLLKHHKQTPFYGCNILLHGEPGSGKTQLSRVLTLESDFQCYEVNFSNSHGEQLTGEQRLDKLTTARNFLNDDGNLIIFDELEDAFPNDFGFSSSSSPQKRWFNELLETNLVPVIWISNSIDHIDPAFLRRFDYCLKVTQPNYTYKKNMLSTLIEVDKTLPWVEKIAKHKSITVADIERAQFFMSATGTNTDKQKEYYFNNILTSRGSSIGRTRKNKSSPEYISETEFSPELSNTSEPLDTITRIVERSEEGRFLLHGIPGTGKTGYVHYLAKKLNKELVSKSASDLLGAFVGQNEKAIRSMFAEAKHKDAILLLDEADSFFSNRAEHNSEWRTSMVNEMLVQLERFQGVFFASTNLLDKIDTAIKRRFDFSITFDYLSSSQVNQMASKMLLKTNNTSGTAFTHPELDELTNITPADFSVAVRQARLRDEPLCINNLIKVLREQSLSRAPKKQRLGFI